MKCTCSKCGYTWTARTEKPIACPRCKRYDWRGAPAERKEVVYPEHEEIVNGLSQNRLEGET